MTTDKERRELNKIMEIKMAVLENEVKNIKNKIDESDRLNAKDHAVICNDVKDIKDIINTAMASKADKSEVAELEGKVNSIDATANNLKTTNAVLAWKVGTIVSILTAAASYAINFFLSKV
jgi:hypothetical protein